MFDKVVQYLEAPSLTLFYKCGEIGCVHLTLGLRVSMCDGDNFLKYLLMRVCLSRHILKGERA